MTFVEKFKKYLELLNNFTLWLGEKNKNSKVMTQTVALSFDVAQVFTTGI